MLMYDTISSRVDRAIVAAGEKQTGVSPYGDHLRSEVTRCLDYVTYARVTDEELAEIVFLAWVECTGEKNLYQCLAWAWGEVVARRPPKE